LTVNPHICFIGAGNMASSLISGLLNSGFEATSIRAADPATTQLKALAERGVVTTSDNAHAIAGAEVVVLAVKPQVLGAVAQLLPLTAEQLVVSIAAGVPLASLQGWTTPTQPIVRCMPNTPALVGAGITALFANDNVTPSQRQQAETLLGAAGKTLWVASEDLLDAVTAVSGSGPAYFFYLMEAMIEAGQALGLDTNTAISLTIETAYGAARMARDGDTPPGALRANVTSPGGTTQRALSILDAADCQGIIRAALHGAAQRSAELAKEFGSNDPAA
jgi:pyrroline-5-carboxylate reductase